MAIKNKLSKDSLTNIYGIDFSEAYYKIEDVKTKLDEGIATIFVRAYANKEARERINFIEGQRKYWSSLSMGGDKFDRAFEKQKDYKSIEEYRKYIEKQEDLFLQNIVGVFKESYEIKLKDLKIKSFDKNGIIKAAYLWIKDNVKEVRTGVDC